MPSNSTLSELRDLASQVERLTNELILKLAETGLAATSGTGKRGWESDPLLTPSQAAKELGVSWATLRDSWGLKYEIRHSGGSGKNRRYKSSEIERVKQLVFCEREADHG